MSKILLGALLATSLVSANATEVNLNPNCTEIRIAGTNCSFCGKPVDFCRRFEPPGCYKCPQVENRDPDLTKQNDLDLKKNSDLDPKKNGDLDLVFDNNSTIQIPSGSPVNVNLNEGFDWMTGVWIAVGTAIVVLFVVGYLKKQVVFDFFKECTGSKAFSALEGVLEQVIKK